MARKKYNPDEIDEDLIISTIQHEKQASEQPKTQIKPQPTVKKSRTTKDYDSLLSGNRELRQGLESMSPYVRNTTKRYSKLCV